MRHETLDDQAGPFEIRRTDSRLYSCVFHIFRTVSFRFDFLFHLLEFLGGFMDRVVIIGSGAAGLSAAIRLAEENVPSFIVEEMPPWRAQSNMAEGGINAALDTMGQHDEPALHEEKHTKRAAF